MNDRQSGMSSSTAVIIAVVVVVLVAIPCLLAVGLLGAGIVVYRTQEEYRSDLNSLLEEPPTPVGEPAAPSTTDSFQAGKRRQ